jgi:hypothetical protein
MAKMLIVVFRVVTLCNLVGGYQHFRGMYASIFRTEMIFWIKSITTHSPSVSYNSSLVDIHKHTHGMMLVDVASLRCMYLQLI